MADKKELTERQKAFLEYLAGEAGGDIRTAMDLAGYSPNTRINDAIKPIKDEVIEVASMMIALNAPKAAGAMIGVLHDPSALGAKNIISAAKEVMDRAGVIKREKIEVESTGGGLFILPPKAE